MPEIKQLTRHFRNNESFAMLSISLDDPATTPDLRRTIREHRIRYPVLHVGAEDGWNDGSFDWDINGVPSAYIIDPQGNIFADVYPRKELIDVFEALIELDNPPPPVGLDVATELRDDGSVEVKLKLASPTHAPLDVGVDVTKIVPFYNPERDPEGTGEVNDREYVEMGDELGLDFTATFGDFGETVVDFVIPAQDDAVYMYVAISVGVPGMEDFNGGEGYAVTSFSYIPLPQDTE